MERDMLAGHAYEAGAPAVAVCTDKEVYGLDVDSIKMVVKSQRYDKGKYPGPLFLLACNKGKYPGPLPVLAYDFFLDPCQLAHVADAGAEAVNLNVAALGEKTKHMLEEAERMGLDAVVQVHNDAELAIAVHNEAELAIAIAAGASIIGVVNRDMETFLPQNEMDGVSRLWIEPFEQTVFGRLIPLIPGGIMKVAAGAVNRRVMGEANNMIPDGIVKVASGAVNETLAAWTLRDKGYTSILVGEAVIKGSESQMAGSSYQGAYNEGKGLMIAYRSKGSLKYGPSSTASFYGKGEGAKETLGMMSI
ncbi:hypothetical protein T484DRAFT_1879627 [Baffinella frigidus]|nr:hypothetical protein T484DRAFT_1879627 [Cryptophyta sp. CCMP2293]